MWLNLIKSSFERRKYVAAKWKKSKWGGKAEPWSMVLSTKEAEQAVLKVSARRDGQLDEFRWKKKSMFLLMSSVLSKRKRKKDKD